MAKDKTAPGDEPEPPAAPKGGIKNWLLLAAVGLIAAATGFALPQILTGTAPVAEPTVPESEATTKHESGGSQPMFLPFGDVVVNLAEERLARYLRVNITLVVDAPYRDSVKAAIDKKKIMLKNWLIGYLSDKALDEVRGAVGVNRARREIQDQFNNLLFPDGSERIRDVLFEEFIVE